MSAKTHLAPILSVRRGREAIAFYEEAFGAAVLFRIDDDQGAVVGQLSADGAEFWVADESPENENFSPESLSGSTSRMLLVVDNPDHVFAQAITAGATEIWPVGEQHGWRVGRIRDPFGHHWEIGKPIEQA
jgi:PhnB protein